MLKYWGLYCFYSVHDGCSEEGDDSEEEDVCWCVWWVSRCDTMWCDDAFLLACCGSNWGGAGREGTVLWKVKEESSWKGKRERQSRVLKNSITFFFLYKLC